MRKYILAAIVAIAALMIIGPSPAWAGSPHFVSVSATTSDDTLTVWGKEAGLGNEDAVHIVVDATAICVNPGHHHPKAANKASFSSDGYFPVQNGKADFSLSLTATFTPDCSPPMTVEWTSITVTDTTNGISKQLK